MLAAAIDGIVNRHTLRSVEGRLVSRFNSAGIATINDFLTSNYARLV